ncbi:hypothetical protein Dsin_020842 [Dipteronia sinensis]|uniref:RING-type domain-containing protein n=1 Tax=Dipteronia sinensis TaxID=43782 RepID=A0AAE0AA20_9ROSI|nr:hypothetical protein Dsin_020842 [Dipteronia sinensis]
MVTGRAKSNLPFKRRPKLFGSTSLGLVFYHTCTRTRCGFLSLCPDPTRDPSQISIMSPGDEVKLSLYLLVYIIVIVVVYRWVVLIIFKCNESTQTNNHLNIDIEPGDTSGARANNRAGGGRQQQLTAGQTFSEVSWRSDETNCRDCAICLDEFSDGEECRVGSTCKHIFHKYCIDRWLLKNTQCPLCRVPVQITSQ